MKYILVFVGVTLLTLSDIAFVIFGYYSSTVSNRNFLAAMMFSLLFVLIWLFALAVLLSWLDDNKEKQKRAPKMDEEFEKIWNQLRKIDDEENLKKLNVLWEMYQPLTPKEKESALEVKQTLQHMESIYTQNRERDVQKTRELAQAIIE